jgi:hypothetical protein
MNDGFARIALTAGIALAPLSIVTPTVHANPLLCAGLSGDNYQRCATAMEQDRQKQLQICDGRYAAIGGDVALCEKQVNDNYQIAPPAQETTTASATPSSTAVSTTSPPNVSSPPVPTTKPATIKPPKSLTASSSAIDAAKSNRTQIDPANPPKPPTDKTFDQRVQDVVRHHRGNLDVVKGQAHPRLWDFIDYDEYHRPVFYNPMSEGMTFRYFYQGDYREAYVEASSSVALNVSVGGVFPFTAVGEDYLTSGCFNGGAWVPPDGWTGPPPLDYTAPQQTLYEDVAVYLPAYGQTVGVGDVQPVGHDDSQPAGSQDTFMLNGSTLAWGQANQPGDNGQITVTKTQTLPGVGPTDDGKSLVDLAAAAEPQSNNTGIVVALVIGIGLAVLALGVCIWLIRRRKGRSKK